MKKISKLIEPKVFLLTFGLIMISVFHGSAQTQITSSQRDVIKEMDIEIFAFDSKIAQMENELNQLRLKMKDDVSVDLSEIEHQIMILKAVRSGYLESHRLLVNQKEELIRKIYLDKKN